MSVSCRIDDYKMTEQLNFDDIVIKVTITIKYNHIINMLYLNLLITTLTFDHYHDHAFLKANSLLLTKIYQIL
jgi:hypothetical protein